MPTRRDARAKFENSPQPEKPGALDEHDAANEAKSAGKIVAHNLSRQPEDIAMAAYYRAEKRGFEAGHDIEDWLEAEAELNQSNE